MTPNNLLCFHCMEHLDAPNGVCPHCGYDNRIRDNGSGMLGSIILDNQYQIGRVLGRGGFGVTYIGYDTKLQTRVAIKEYYPAHLVARGKDDLTLSALAGNDDSYQKGLEHALRESRVAAGLRHVPGVVQVHNVFTANNTVYIVMDYVDGDTLSNYVQENSGMLTLPKVLNVLGPVSRALQVLHSRKVIHRDVKPDNIMISKETGQGVLLDFGAARIADDSTMSRSSAVVSAGYAPPEQYNMSALDGRIDQYALAATLLYALTGHRPPDVMERIAQANAMPSIRAVNSTVNATAENIIYKAMALKAANRHNSVKEFWELLEKAAFSKGKGTSGKLTPVKIIALALSVTLAGGALAYFVPRSGLWKSNQPAVSTGGTSTGSLAGTTGIDPTMPIIEQPTEKPGLPPADGGEATALPTATPTAVPTEEPGTVLQFENERVENAVRDALMRPEGNITAEMVAKLPMLDLSDCNMSDLSILSNFTSLKTLNLSNNPIESLEPLASLINLKSLTLVNCSLTNIEALAGLVNLNTLYLANNNITDYTPLKNIKGLVNTDFDRDLILVTPTPAPTPTPTPAPTPTPVPTPTPKPTATPLPQYTKRPVPQFSENEVTIHNEKVTEHLNQLLGLEKKATYGTYSTSLLASLTELDLTKMSITETSFLKYFTGLQRLTLKGNAISDLRFVEYLVNLEHLDLSDNRVTDLKPLSWGTSLKTLNLENNQLKDTTNALSELYGLEELDLSGNKLGNTTIIDLSNLALLKGLDLSDNQISNITLLRNLVSLNTLHLANNQVNEVSSLRTLQQLVELDVSGNKITRISDLAELPALEVLNLSGNDDVLTMRPFETMTQLKNINVSGMNLRDIDFLSEITDLQVLDISRNKVSDLSVLSGFKNLTVLNFDGNQVTTLNPLYELKELTELSFVGNKVSSLEILQEHEKLQVLHAASNKITTFYPLRNMQGLVKATVSSNSAKDYFLLKPLLNRGVELDVSQSTISEKVAVPFRDDAVRRVVETQLREADNSFALTTDSVGSVEKLVFTDLQTDDWSFLRYFTGLKELTITGCNFEDVLYVYDIASLETLDLQNNKIVDAYGLERLEKLHTLYLAGNDLQYYPDVEWIRQLENTDIVLTAELISLIENQEPPTLLDKVNRDARAKYDQQQLQESATFENPEVEAIVRAALGVDAEAKLKKSDIAAMEELSIPSLEKGLGDINFLAQFTGLKRLDLSGNKLVDLSPLAALEELEELNASNNQITDVTPLASMTSLKKIDLSQNAIQDETPLLNLPALEWLSLKENQLTATANWTTSASITHLDLSSNRIFDVRPMENWAISSLLYENNLTYTPIVFPSSRCEAAVREAFGKPEGDILVVEALDVETLEVPKTGIKDLSFIECFVSLKVLNLADNSIADLSPLQDLQNLQQVNLANNDNIADISPLAGKDIIWLDISQNKVEDISVLASMVNMQELSIAENKMLEDISCLSGMSQLTKLTANHCRISDLTPLLGLEQLVWLDLDHNQLVDIYGLLRMPWLEYLDLASNKIADITPTAYLPNLTDLLLKDNPIEDYSPLRQGKKRTNLPSDLSEGKIDSSVRFSFKSDAQANAFCRAMNKHEVTGITSDDALRFTTLRISGREVDDISFLKYFKNLTSLEISNMPITDISCLKSLIHLENLTISNCLVSDLSPLIYMSELKNLTLCDNDIRFLDPLAGLPQLSVLDIRNNKINDLTPLASVTSLTSLTQAGNFVPDYSVLSALPVLEATDFGNQHRLPSPVVTIDNPEAEAIVRAAVNKPEGNLLVSDVSKIKSLNLNGLGLYHVDFLRNFTGLTELVITNNRLTNLEAISGLFRLEKLQVKGNPVYDFFCLGELRQLKQEDVDFYLNLRYEAKKIDFPSANVRDMILKKLGRYRWNDTRQDDLYPQDVLSITSLSFDEHVHTTDFLRYFVNLKELALNDHGTISDISALGQLPYLEKVSLRNNDISDLTPLTQCKFLREADLTGNLIVDLSPIAQMESLSVLILNDNNQIESVEKLSTLPNLQSLSINNTRIVDISPLSKLKTLERLSLVNNRIEDARPLHTLLSLQYLDLSNNKLVTISSLRTLVNLQTLHVHGNSLTNLNGIETMAVLNNLGFDRNQISDLTPASHCSQLTVLSGQENLLTDISPLMKLTALERVWLDHNQISQLEPLSGLVNLKLLSITHNHVVDLSPIGDLRGLKSLYSFGNRIQDYTPLLGAYSLSEFDHLAHLISTEKKIVFPLHPLTERSTVEKIIRDVLGIPGRDIFPADVVGVKQLDLSGQGLTEVNSFLSFFTGLEELDLSGNDIKDLHGLEGMTNLKKLDVSGNDLPNIGALDEVASLEWIDVSSNRLTSLNPLANKPALQYVNASNNKIKRLDPFAENLALTTIVADNNEIDNIDALATLVNVTELHLRSNKIRDAQPLAGMAALQMVDISNNKVQDAFCLVDLKTLKYIDISCNELEDLWPFIWLPQLQTLKVCSSTIKDYFPLTYLPNTEFDVVDQLIETAVPIEFADAQSEEAVRMIINKPTGDIYPSEVCHVTEFSLNNARISDITFLKNFVSLTSLSLADNQLSDLTPLRQLSALEELDLSSNRIGDISPLSRMTNLAWINLNDNQVQDLSPMNGMTGLMEAYLSNNRIEDLTPLANATELVFLDLNDNRLSDVSPLLSLVNLEEVVLTNNSKLTDVSCLSQLPVLKYITVDE